MPSTASMPRAAGRPGGGASSVTPGPDGTDAVKKILGGVASIAVGVAELRNRGYGTGHGQATAPTNLGIRHAQLAANAAITWCQLMLDTLGDPDSPWRRVQWCCTR
ncbi:abortive infection family protein [Streptomyces sp. NPDC049577]|uniref:abortive infection family protein n=1 Tax=Streptomyces sp. NPDC049577 TaxID=3155153 RepID=UPI003438D625